MEVNYMQIPEPTAFEGLHSQQTVSAQFDTFLQDLKRFEPGNDVALNNLTNTINYFTSIDGISQAIDQKKIGEFNDFLDANPEIAQAFNNLPALRDNLNRNPIQRPPSRIEALPEGARTGPAEKPQQPEMITNTGADFDKAVQAASQAPEQPQAVPTFPEPRMAFDAVVQAASQAPEQPVAVPLTAQKKAAMIMQPFLQFRELEDTCFKQPLTPEKCKLYLETRANMIKNLSAADKDEVLHQLLPENFVKKISILNHGKLSRQDTERLIGTSKMALIRYSDNALKETQGKTALVMSYYEDGKYVHLAISRPSDEKDKASEDKIMTLLAIPYDDFIPPKK
jgi:hypothetical protein